MISRTARSYRRARCCREWARRGPSSAWPDPTWLDPDFVHALRQIRFRGGFARIHLALSEAPRFEGLVEPPAGTIVLAPSLDHVERAYDDAKHGGVSGRPVLEARVPSLADPTLAPAGRHVMSVDVRFIPVDGREGSAGLAGSEAGDALADRVHRDPGRAGAQPPGRDPREEGPDARGHGVALRPRRGRPVPG